MPCVWREPKAHKFRPVRHQEVEDMAQCDVSDLAGLCNVFG